MIKYANTGPILLPPDPAVPSTANTFNPSGPTNQFIDQNNQQIFAPPAVQLPTQLVQSTPSVNFFNPIPLDAPSFSSSQRSTPAFVNQPLPSAPTISKNSTPVDLTKPSVQLFQPQEAFPLQPIQQVQTVEKRESPINSPIEVQALEEPQTALLNPQEFTTPSNLFQPTPPSKYFPWFFIL